MAVPSHRMIATPSSLIPAIICSILGIALYLNTLDCGLCFDDVSAITTNQDLRPDTPWSNLLWNDFWGTPMDKEGSHKSYRPLTVFTFKLNYLIHSTDPLGYHIVNTLLHGAVCFYFVLICNLAVFQGGLSHHNGPAAITPLWISGICFAVHPIHTEAVAGVVGRAETLSAMFFLACFHCYWKSLFTGRVLWLLVSLVMCLCSVLSKEQGVTVLAVCVCYEYFIFNKNTLKSSASLVNAIWRGQNQPLWLRRFCVNVTVLVSFLLAVMFFRVKIMKAELPVFTVHDNPAVGLSTPYRQLHWLYLVFQNVWLLLTPSQLCADWTMGTVPLIQSLIDPRNILTAATLLCIAVLGLYSISNTRRLNNGVHFGLLLMILPFIPASNLLFPVGFVVAERILYVPSMGYCILLAIGFHKLLTSCHSKSLRSLLVKSLILWLIVSHSCKTIERNRDWLSAETLFVSAIHVNPRNGKLLNNLGHHHESLGNHTYAEVLFRKAAEVQPDDIGAYINLGRVLNALNKPTESEQAYRRAIKLMPSGTSFRVAPSHINVYFNLANLIRQDSSRLEESLTLYQRAISMKPDFSEAYMNMGDVYLKLDKTTEAKRAFRNAIKHKEDYSDAYFNLATINLQLKEVSEAEEGYRTALHYNPDHALSLYNLGIMLSEQKSGVKLAEAKKLLERLLKLQPENDRGHFQLGIVHTELGEIDQAVDAFQTALDINPTYRAALYNQAFLLYQMKQTEKAFENLLTLKEHHPDHAKGMQILGDIYMLKDEVDEAISAYELCLRTNPNHVTAIHNLGVAMTKKEDFAKAVEYFSLAIKLHPDYEPYKKHLEGAKMELQKQLKK